MRDRDDSREYIINRHFKANEVECGIGIDAGKMLATKTGLRRKGAEQANYKNLVWLRLQPTSHPS